MTPLRAGQARALLTPGTGPAHHPKRASASVQHGAPGPDREGQAEPSASQQLGRLGAHGLRGLRHLFRRVDVGLALVQQPRHLHVTVHSRHDQGGKAGLRAWAVRWSRGHVPQILSHPPALATQKGFGSDMAEAC